MDGTCPRWQRLGVGGSRPCLCIQTLSLKGTGRTRQPPSQANTGERRHTSIGSSRQDKGSNHKPRPRSGPGRDTHETQRWRPRQGRARTQEAGGSLHVLQETVLGQGAQPAGSPQQPCPGCLPFIPELVPTSRRAAGPRPLGGLARAGLRGDLRAHWEMPGDHLEQDPDPLPAWAGALGLCTPRRGGGAGDTPWRDREHSPKSLVQTARSTSVSPQGRQGAAGTAGASGCGTGPPGALCHPGETERGAPGRRAAPGPGLRAGSTPSLLGRSSAPGTSAGRPELRSRPLALRLPHPHPKVQAHPLAHRLLPKPRRLHSRGG